MGPKIGHTPKTVQQPKALPYGAQKHVDLSTLKQEAVAVVVDNKKFKAIDGQNVEERYVHILLKISEREK